MAGGSDPTNSTTDPKTDAPTMSDERWAREVYRGDVPQLTPRAVIAGMLLGGVLSLSNLYVSLRMGWSFGVTITAALLAFALFGGLRAIGVVKTNLGILENNAMQSVASAAGYMTGGGTVAAIPGLMLLTGEAFPAWKTFLWISALAFLGVFLAIPMKRQMINREQLRFPSGVASAELLKSLYGDASKGAETTTPDGAKEGQTQAISLVVAAVLTGIYTALRKRVIPESISFPGRLRSVPLASWTLSFDTSLVLIAGGALMGFRSAWSMALGAVLNFGLLAPHGYDVGAIPHDAVSYRNIVNYTLWFGSSLLLTAGLLGFVIQPGQLARIARAFRRSKTKAATSEADPVAHLEVPISWAGYGLLVFGPLIVVFAQLFFDMTWWVAALAVALSFPLAIVAARATGETDTTPSGSLAKIAQLVSGALAPGSVVTNLLSANIAAGVAIHASDLLTDLKSGYLLGANPRQQFFGQFFGVMAGSLFVVPAMALLVPDASVIGTEAVPAPGAISWTAVARVFAGGLHSLPEAVKPLILAGATVGVALAVLEVTFAKARKFIPSPIAFGLAFTLPASNTISMVLGAVIAKVLEEGAPSFAKRYVVAVASGVVAGESLVGVGIAALTALGWLPE